ncbi:DUF2249 domain-containing protein [Aquabacterium sp. A7-Y]|uniref:DUF2249 domain-containing protein n=1 Tax=Aquabacterium sp. A7-Y TaxID=1349605 RepID=UPI00223CF07E|nr:DUF2249 domain-containing protein [Aquabacterium sp. A7-Y]MCW7537900.1 DUF2249 domain-containing protein [Aquabacterium sp. A7-Y]
MSQAPQATLDVRPLLPRDRHARIFQTLDRLTPGGALELLNDHDPIPLYHHLQAQYPGRYSWQVLEQGPDVWRVRIGRQDSGSNCCGGCCH